MSSDVVLGAGLVTTLSDMTAENISHCSLPEAVAISKMQLVCSVFMQLAIININIIIL